MCTFQAAECCRMAGWLQSRREKKEKKKKSLPPISRILSPGSFVMLTELNAEVLSLNVPKTGSEIYLEELQFLPMRRCGPCSQHLAPLPPACLYQHSQEVQEEEGAVICPTVASDICQLPVTFHAFMNCYCAPA